MELDLGYLEGSVGVWGEGGVKVFILLSGCWLEDKVWVVLGVLIFGNVFLVLWEVLELGFREGYIFFFFKVIVKV